MKKCISLLLVLLLAIGTLGCAETVANKEVPAEFADAQSVLAYLKQQSEITQTGTSRVVGAIYDIESGTVDFFE